MLFVGELVVLDCWLGCEVGVTEQKLGGYVTLFIHLGGRRGEEMNNVKE